jgi:hypothetical protein
VMVCSLLVFEYLITLAAPVWERWLFHGGDQASMRLLQALDERLLTTGDLRQFLESVLAAVCDRLQASRAFIAGVGAEEIELLVHIGDIPPLEDMQAGISQLASYNGSESGFFTWDGYWLVPLHRQRSRNPVLIGLLGVAHPVKQSLDIDLKDALQFLARRAAVAMEDRLQQQEIFSSLESLSPQIGMIQRLRAAARYDGASMLNTPDAFLDGEDITKWVKDALTHYWGGPKLTNSPLMRLLVVQKILEEHKENPSNALRAILRQAIEQIRPEGDRRFTGEWILYNILEMKFMEGKKVREIALRLSMSEADLYRKQRVAIDAVANAIIDVEYRMRTDIEQPGNMISPNNQGTQHPVELLQPQKEAISDAEKAI